MILVTGGTGYIGSHICVALLNAGYPITILDNLSTSHCEVLNRIKQITGISPPFIKGDVRNSDLLDNLFAQNHFKAVIHLAGVKAVGESVQKPLEYYQNNVTGALTLLQAIRRAKIPIFIFSSSATVYGDPITVPIRENFPLSATNPYGRSKLIVENILRDLHNTEPASKTAILRYFNPVGAHKSGLIGEEPKGVPSNLMPYITQVANGRREKLYIFGNDYPTIDGTGVRDYIHITDLAEGHVAVLRYLENNHGLVTFNLGTGKGYSVLEILSTFEKVTGCYIPYEIVGRRSGDIPICFADPRLANQKLGWKTKLTLEDMCADTWRWQSMNPNGFILTPEVLIYD